MTGLQKGVLESVIYKWEDDDTALTEIDMLTSTYALFDDSS